MQSAAQVISGQQSKDVTEGHVPLAADADQCSATQRVHGNRNHDHIHLLSRSPSVIVVNVAAGSSTVVKFHSCHLCRRGAQDCR